MSGTEGLCNWHGRIVQLARAWSFALCRRHSTYLRVACSRHLSTNASYGSCSGGGGGWCREFLLIALRALPTQCRVQCASATFTGSSRPSAAEGTSDQAPLLPPGATLMTRAHASARAGGREPRLDRRDRGQVRTLWQAARNGARSVNSAQPGESRLSGLHRLGHFSRHISIPGTTQPSPVLSPSRNIPSLPLSGPALCVLSSTLPSLGLSMPLCASDDI
eukprot:6185838-Pleurochrysis_carterae.AAC.5